ncbi:hypothetical protein [Treponema sp.]|uniref:hypothetical protein n=1 Tax=Treponema sp. TaxID=166 RepID=UPI00388D3430
MKFWFLQRMNLQNGRLFMMTGNSVLWPMGIGFVIGSEIAGCITPWVYSANRNESLKTALNLPVESITMLPLIDPTTESYGLVAKINF